MAKWIPRPDSTYTPLSLGENIINGRTFWVCKVKDIPDAYWKDVTDNSFWQLDWCEPPVNETWFTMSCVSPGWAGKMGSGKRHWNELGYWEYSHTYAAIPIKYRTDKPTPGLEPTPVEWGEESY